MISFLAFYVVALLIGFFLGRSLRGFFYPAKDGANWGISIFSGIVGWILAALILAVLAQLFFGADQQPTWVGSTALFFSIALLLGIKKSQTPRDQKIEGVSNGETQYELALNELENGQFVRGIWAQAFAESDGDENKTKATYIRLRVAQLKEGLNPPVTRVSSANLSPGLPQSGASAISPKDLTDYQGYRCPYCQTELNRSSVVCKSCARILPSQFTNQSEQYMARYKEERKGDVQPRFGQEQIKCHCCQSIWPAETPICKQCKRIL